MFTFKKFAMAAVVVVVGAMSSMAMADHPRYELKRVNTGPRSETYAYVRAERSEARERPYALTGSDREAAERREADRPMPQHLKGPRGNY